MVDLASPEGWASWRRTFSAVDTAISHRPWHQHLDAHLKAFTKEAVTFAVLGDDKAIRRFCLRYFPVRDLPAWEQRLEQVAAEIRPT